MLELKEIQRNSELLQVETQNTLPNFLEVQEPVSPLTDFRAELIASKMEDLKSKQSKPNLLSFWSIDSFLDGIGLLNPFNLDSLFPYVIMFLLEVVFGLWQVVGIVVTLVNFFKFKNFNSSPFWFLPITLFIIYSVSFPLIKNWLENRLERKRVRKEFQQSIQQYQAKLDDYRNKIQKDPRFFIQELQGHLRYKALYPLRHRFNEIEGKFRQLVIEPRERIKEVQGELVGLRNNLCEYDLGEEEKIKIQELIRLKEEQCQDSISSPNSEEERIIEKFQEVKFELEKFSSSIMGLSDLEKRYQELMTKQAKKDSLYKKLESLGVSLGEFENMNLRDMGVVEGCLEDLHKSIGRMNISVHELTTSIDAFSLNPPQGYRVLPLSS